MFEFPLDPAELFAERSRQFAGWGIPEHVVSRVRARVDDMWGDTTSSWTPSWAAEATAAEAEQDWLTAAFCWGAARFPCVNTPARQQAYRRQFDCYRKALEDSPVPVERRVLKVPYRSATTSVPVYLWCHDIAAARSLLIVSGGVDTWKVELHRTALAAARLPGTAVAVLDMPGTGESAVPLAADADEILTGVVDELADLTGAQRTAFLGISFGGHWAAKLALTRRLDAAVDIGGPVGADGATLDITALPNGMPGIVGNALGLDALPTSADATDFATAFSLRRQGVLNTGLRTPLLVINGSADPYVPPQDTTVFTADPNATVWLIRDAAHCAAEHFPKIVPAALAWTTCHLDPSPTNTTHLNQATAPLTPLLA